MLVFINTFALIVFFLCMAWAVPGHFKGRAASKMILTTVINAAAVTWLLWERWRVLAHRSEIPLWRESASITITALALALFWWAVAVTRRTRLTLAFSSDTPSFLVERGPYALVRHPFYTSYVLFWISASISSASLLYWAVPVVITAIYVRAATLEEAKFLNSALAPRYRDYQSRTGMIAPRIRLTKETVP